MMQRKEEVFFTIHISSDTFAKFGVCPACCRNSRIAITYAYLVLMPGTAEECQNQGVVFLPIVVKSLDEGQLGYYHKPLPNLPRVLYIWQAIRKK